MKVTLTAEGTYPHQFGGVSVWCDQLIRALPGYEFEVTALVATGAEPVQWEPPANVTRLATIPLWGSPPATPWRGRLPRPSRWGPGGRGVPLPVRDLITEILRAPVPGVTDGEPPGGEAFGWVLRELCGFAQDRSLTAALSSEAAVRLFYSSWHDRWPAMPAAAGVQPPTLHDAVTALRLVEHALRPLSHPPARADLTHVATNGLGTLPALAAKWRLDIPFVVSEHGVYLREQYLHQRQPSFGWPVKELYLRFLAQLCALGYREAELIIPGNAYNRRWEAQLGADSARVRTVYNGVNPADFPLITSEPAEPVITWVGRIDPIKDLETLLRAHALVVRQLPRAKLRIFGTAARGQEPYRRHCEVLARDLGLDGAVTFEGRVPAIKDAYAAGTIVVLCSLSEGFPYAIIEAMTCGRACVATDVGGVSEALADGAGLVVPPRDAAALADGCLRLLRDPVQRAVIGAAARRRALEHFSADRAMGSFDEIYTMVGNGGQVLPPSGGPGTEHEAADAAAASARSGRAGLGPAMVTEGGIA